MLVAEYSTCTKRSAGSIPQLFKWGSSRFTQLWFWLAYLSIYSVCSPDLNKCLEDGRPHSSISVSIWTKKAFNHPSWEGYEPTPRFAGCCWSSKQVFPSRCLAGASEGQKNHEMQGTDRSAPSAARENPLLNITQRSKGHPEFTWTSGHQCLQRDGSVGLHFLLSNIWVERSPHSCDRHSQLPKKNLKNT